MKELKIQNSEILALVDDADYDKISHYTWYLSNGAIKRYHASGKFSRGFVPIANQILGIRGVIIDHKDRNIYNNIRDNFRIATHQQNSFNRGKITRVCSSRYKGVSLSYGKWRTCLYLKGKAIFIERFVDEHDAAQVYNFKAEELFGEFAVFNEVLERQHIIQQDGILIAT